MDTVLRRCAVLPRRTTVLHQYLRIVLPARIPVLQLYLGTVLPESVLHLYFNCTCSLSCRGGSVDITCGHRPLVCGHLAQPPLPWDASHCLYFIALTCMRLYCIAFYLCMCFALVSDVHRCTPIRHLNAIFLNVFSRM